MKKALILGIGDAQTDAIRYLKEAGWWVAASAHRKEGRGLTWVDHFELIDIGDGMALEKIAEREGVQLIYSVGSDLAMPTVAKIAKKLGLPSFFEPETLEAMQNKILLREMLAAHRLDDTRYRKVGKMSDIKDWSYFPAVLKPADNQGQRGVFLVRSMRELEGFLDRALEYSMAREAILEEYLEGVEISVNTFVLDSQVVFQVASDRKVKKDFFGIPEGHTLPSQSCTGPMGQEVKALVDRCVRTFGVRNGPVYFQMKLTLQGPRILEITPRLDGCHLWRLIKTSCGVDLLEASFRRLMNETSFRFTQGVNFKSCYLGFLLSPPASVFNPADHVVSGEPLFLEYYYRKNDKIRPINGRLEKVGYYIKELD